MRNSRVKHFELAKDSLLELAFRRVDDSMLREIAGADYGMHAKAHLRRCSTFWDFAAWKNECGMVNSRSIYWRD